MKGIKFLVAFVFTFGLLYGLVTIFMKIPINEILAIVFAFISFLVAIAVALKKKGVHAGYGIMITGLILMIGTGTLAFGAIDFTFQGEQRERFWNIDDQIITYLIMGVGGGFALFVLGCWLSWRKWLNK